MLICRLFLDYEKQRQERRALEESEDRFRKIFAEGGVGMAMARQASGPFISVNGAFCEMLGYTEAELKLLTFVEITHPEDRAEDAEAVRRLWEGQIPKHYAEKRYLKKNGEVLWGARVLTKIGGADGKSSYALAMIQNMTERKQAEAAVREHTAFLNTLLEAIPAPVFYKDTEGRYLGFNQAFETFYGQQRAALVGKTVFDIAPRELAEVYYAQDLALFRNPGVQVYEAKMRDTQGRLHDMVFHKATFKDAGGRVSGLLGVILDITERKRAEEELARAVREWQTTFDATNDAIWVLDQDHRVLRSNQTAERFFHRPCRAMLGEPCWTIVHGTTAPYPDCPSERARQSGHRELMELRVGEQDFEVRVDPIFDAAGQYAGAVHSVSDITQKKELEARFQRAQRLESIGALAGGLAHDLNNILSPILITAPMLREMATDPEGRALADNVAICAQRAADVIKQLLTFARGQPGARALVPLGHLLKETHSIIRETFPRNIESRLLASKDLWTLVGDATQIHQALMNLCVNARDAMPQGGRLTLTAENRLLDEGFAAMTPGAKPGDYLCLSVSDTGTGIAPQHLERIFEPFFTTKEFGTGLGLASVAGIARGHGGFVRVQSRLGQGTTFALFLPASREPAANAGPMNEPPPPRGQGELILVVDDEPTVRGAVRHVLEQHGYRVLEVGDGVAALAAFGERGAEFHAVLTDLMMPQMDGLMLARVLRQMNPRLPILGMTGLTEQVDLKGVAELHLPPLLPKPFTEGMLLTALSAALKPDPQEQ